jgi:hypothetical protein
VRYPTPTEEGFYWAKFIHPTRGDVAPYSDWEVVGVFENDPSRSDLRVYVGGEEPGKDLDAFVWGPHVSRPADL